MTLAAIGRLVHHSTIVEMNVESYRRREAIERKRERGRPPAFAKNNKADKTERRAASIKALANETATVNDHLTRPPRLI
jgi:hypothetical protein